MKFEVKVEEHKLKVKILSQNLELMFEIKA